MHGLWGAKLAKNDLAKYFLKLRNDHAHGDQYPTSGYLSDKGKTTFHFRKDDGEQKPQRQMPNDIVAVARTYFVQLLEIVYDCYAVLGPHIDPQQYFTKEKYPAGIDEAETEVFGWICVSLIEEGLSEDDRWHELRSHLEECKINHLFYSYLDRVTPQPVMPEEFKDFEYTYEERGWVHIPAGFTSVEEYRQSKKDKS